MHSYRPVAVSSADKCFAIVGGIAHVLRSDHCPLDAFGMMPSSMICAVVLWPLYVTERSYYHLAAHEPKLLLHRQSPVSGLLSFINSLGQQRPRSMGKLRRMYEDISQPRSQSSTLTVLQWNVLADGLAQNGDFQKVKTLSVAHRSDVHRPSRTIVEQLCTYRYPNRCLHGRGGLRRYFRRLSNLKQT